MTPLQKIAMGLVVIALSTSFGGGWDALPDPLGWLLILLGVRDVRGHLANTTSMFVLAGLSLIVAIATYPPAVTKDLDEAAVWLLDLPQVGFEIVLCAALAAVLGRRTGRWLTVLVWILVVLGVLPAIVIGADLPALADAGLATFALLQLTLIWMLFAASALPETGAKPKAVRHRSPAPE